MLHSITSASRVVYSIVLGLLAAAGAMSGSAGAAEPPAGKTPGSPAVEAAPTESVATKRPIDQKEKFGFGRFVSFKDGTLTLENNAGDLIVWNKIPESAKALKYDPEINDYKEIKGTAAALKEVKPGRYMMVGEKMAFVRIGARVEQVRGTFVSFKNERLLTLGKDLPESFTKRYGNNLHYSKFRDDVPVYESVDGGEYKLIGTANKVLGSVNEGTLVIVHGEGDDNITLIQIGEPTKK
ncbi:hypothetical protein [Humisphaera borealis]|uniref:DUF5666 domain-containing protein n=1 Tax=Humisphaera borealis TaxID=2807512 RepID=A0A7M2WW04_9BACT|nr:hypothetical protein [Humisphaera borealis]QOV89708.1 hypothetical protein IPV69_26565 [Humisphaera borealis]